MTTIANLPLTDDLIQRDPQDMKSPRTLMAKTWVRWFQESLLSLVQSASQLLTAKTLTGQNASIAVTPFTLGSITSGLYEVSWYARVTTAAGVTSSLTPTISWTESGVSLTASGSAMTGNTTGTTTSGSYMFRSDAASPISFSSTYASNPAAAMVYRLEFTVSKID